MTHWQTDGSFVFADISGFTKLSEQLAELGKAGAEELTVLLNATFESLLGVARAEGGDLVKFGGDALFLFFEGVDHAQRACRAAYGMRASLKARGPVVTGRGRVVLRISMGAHSGPFLFVLAGDAQRELFVLGEHATTVTTMESDADAGEILVSKDMAAQLPSSWLGAPKSDGILLRRVTGEPSGATGDFAGDVDFLEPFVPSAIRRRLNDGEHGAEHRRTTIAFVHVGGVDSYLREHGPAAVAERLDAVVKVAVEAAARHEVSLLATDVAGGGIKMILTAGVPESVEDGEGRMLGVGRAIIDADVGLPVRVGVNTGHVFAGEVGAPWRRVYTVMGDAVNLSARFMAKAAHGEVVASKLTLEHSATPFETTPLEPFMVKGKRHPQHAASVGKRIEGHGRERMAHVSFIGRSAELDGLTSAMHRALSAVGACIEIVGEPGIGKSRLAQEVISAAADARVVRLTCEPVAVDRPYFMARVLLRTSLGIGLDAEPADAGRQLLDWLDSHLPDWVPFAPLLAVALDAEVAPTQVVNELGPDFRPLKLREAASAVVHAAFAHPLVLVVEDAMWMDEASALLITEALRRLADAPWFVCFTTRDLADGLSSRLGFESEVMRLEALDAALAEDLAAEVTDSAGVSSSDLAELCARAKGNPLFLLELAHAVRELGSLDAIPGSLEDLIGARIDRLSPADRRLLRHAAVLGDRFAPRLFDRTLGTDFPRPVDWGRLGDFIVIDQGELRFAHDLVRRVAYAGLPFRLRRDLHLRIGNALLPRGEPDDARLGLLALHFDGSGEHEMAWTYNLMAAERARDNYATVESAALFDRAVQNAKAHPVLAASERLAVAYEDMADVALPAGRFDLAREGLRGARRLRKGDAVVFARLCRKEGKLRERQGEHSAAEHWYRRGLVALKPLPEDGPVAVTAERGHLEVERASLLILHQKYRECVRWCERALVHAKASGDRRAEAHAYYLMEWALGELGDETAIRYLELAQPIYEELGDYIGLGRVLLNRGVTYLSRRDWAHSARCFHESRDAFQRSGDLVAKSYASFNLSEQLVEQGRYEEAEELIREARRIWRASGHANGIALVTSVWGRLLGRSGRLAEAIELFHEAYERFEALDNRVYLAETKVRLAEAHIYSGMWERAIEILDEVGDSAADAGPMLPPLARRLRATALTALGDTTTARALLLEARELAMKNGAEWEGALAAVMLNRLPGPPQPEDAAMLAEANGILSDMGIDAERVLPLVA